VHPDCQGQRIGARLLLVLAREAVERGAKGLTLEVRMSNTAARALYGRFGFAPAGVRKNYYPEVGEDALIMWLHDIDQPAFSVRLDEIEADLPPVDLRGQRSGDPTSRADRSG
jgi:[ribosomal protein S18]-alanine N-acetyltransferase